MKLNTNDKTLKLLVRHANNHITMTLNKEQYELDLENMNNNLLCIIDNDIHQQCQYHHQNNHLYLQTFKQTLTMHNITHQPTSNTTANNNNHIKTTMNNTIIDILIQTGQTMKQNDTLIILKTMKIKHPIKADHDSTVNEILTTKNNQIKHNQLLIEITTTDTTSEKTRQ